MAAIRPAPVRNLASADGGFVDLISVLFGSIETTLLPNAPEPSTASPREIAHALIRSMLGEGASNAPTAKEMEDAIAALERNAPPPVIQAPVPIVSAPPSDTLQTVPQTGHGLTLAINTKEVASALPVAPQTELAFGARLTPIARTTPDPSEESPPAPVNEILTKDVMPEEPATSSPRGLVPDIKTRPVAPEREPAIPRIAATGASSESTPDMARASESVVLNPRTDLGPTGGKAETPFATTAQALRSSEPVTPAALSPGATPLQEIALRIARPEASPVDVRVIERGGEIHVAVRTPDVGLQTSLRQDLGALANSLERTGYRTETFTPRDAVTRTAASTEMNFRDERHSPQSGFSGRGGPSEDSRDRQQQQQRQRDQRTQNWLEQLEK